MGKTDAVAIDGPAGAGKSSVGRRLAERLSWTYVDTGAMYRAATLKAVRLGVDLEDASALARAAAEAAIAFDRSGGGERVLLDGEDVTSEIRGPELTRLVRHLAAASGVRERMVEKQRALSGAGPVVMEGRDIGTVVLPDARFKFYLDASPAERARRRAGDLRAAGVEVDTSALEEEIAARDRSDMERATAPLRAARDAVVVDTTGMTEEAVVALLEARVREGLAAGRRPE